MCFWIDILSSTVHTHTHRHSYTHSQTHTHCSCRVWVLGSQCVVLKYKQSVRKKSIFLPVSHPSKMQHCVRGPGWCRSLSLEVLCLEWSQVFIMWSSFFFFFFFLPAHWTNKITQSELSIRRDWLSDSPVRDNKEGALLMAVCFWLGNKRSASWSCGDMWVYVCAHNGWCDIFSIINPGIWDVWKKDT